MGLAKPLHLRAFLEGVEVPVIAAQVQVSLFAPAAASIQVVPVDEGLYFKPRTMVHLFFLEEPSAGYIPSSNSTTGQDRPALTMGDSELADTSYKLLFSGEVIGFSFVKQPMSRNLVLQCLDFSSYWDTLYAAFLDWSKNGNALVEKTALYGSEALFSNMPMADPEHVISGWINRAPRTPGLQHVGGLAGGVIHMMERAGGIYVGSGSHRLGVNDFYTLAELRCHIMQQVAAEENDSTARRLLSIQAFWDWILNEIQTVGNEITLRDMFKLLCRFIYYSIVPNPVAKFERDGAEAEVTKPASKILVNQMPAFSRARQAVQKAYSLISESDPPAQESVLFAKLSMQQASTDLSSIPGAGSDIVSAVQKALSQLTEFANGYSSMDDKAKRTARISSRDALTDASKAFSAGGTEVSKTTKASVFKVHGASRLKTQIFRPDCYMAAPPLCNVVFPEMYSAMNYDRNYAGEVTRVMIMDSARILRAERMNTTDQHLFSNHWLEPSIVSESKEVIRKFGSQWRVLMAHELHTGIIARTEWLPSDFGAINPAQGTAAHAHISWQRSTGLHHFFKYRIAPRTMNVAGRFNPYMVAGFPALVIQKPFYYEEEGLTDEELLSKVENTTIAQKDLRAPPQFLGMVEGLQHSISQEGGQTTFSMSHCRTHVGIDDEFVGLVMARAAKGEKHSSRVRYSLVYDNVKSDAAKLKFLVECTPQTPVTKSSVVKTGSKTSPTSFTQKQAGASGTSSTETSADVKAPVSSTETSETSYTKDSAAPWDASTIVQVPNGTSKALGSAGLYGGKVAFVQVLAPYDVVTTDVGKRAFSAVTVYEDLQVSIEGAEIPVEEILRPRWLSPAYSNERVGKDIYQNFFGCGSILDQIRFDETLTPQSDESGTDVMEGETSSELITRLSGVEKSRAHYSIERAVNVISYIYGKVRKSGGVDVDEFITSLTKRPIATKKDILGSYDLELHIEGDQPVVDKGEIGFHTLSVHTQTSSTGRLVGLTEDPAATLQRMDRYAREIMAAKYDVRWEKLERVMKYREALERGAGLGYVG